MKKNANFKVQIKVLTVLLIFTMTTFFIAFPTNISNSYDTMEEDLIKEEDTDYLENYDNEIESIKSPKFSTIKNDPWWNESYKYRQLINITNPYSTGLIDYPVSINFNYTELDMNQTHCYDVRIVENGIPRKYYVKMDYPQNNYTTVWFDTNVTATNGGMDQDTYLYFGNMTVKNDPIYYMDMNNQNERFGWVKNGDFELDTVSPRIDNDLDGWTWTDNQPDYQGSRSTSDRDDLDQHNVTSITTGQMGVGHGQFAYKWGTKRDSVPDYSYSDDYAGTLYSHPFVIPRVTEQGEKIYLHLWRNIRGRSFDGVTSHPYQDGYFLRLCNATSYGSLVQWNHEDIEHIELYEGENSDNDMYFSEYENAAVTVNTASGSDELTGIIDFDVTAYQGQEMFLEIGMWGNEGGADEGFGQLDEVRFNFILDIVLNEVQTQKAEVKIIARDVDGRQIEGVDISLVKHNFTTGETNVLETQTTSGTGTITFLSVDYDTYNFTAEYELNSGLKATVFNSTKDNYRTPDWNKYNFTGLHYTYEIQLNLTTFDFEIVDHEENPLYLAFVNISYGESPKINIIETLTLNSEGKATFSWLNRSGGYYYEIYYNNSDFDVNPILLNESYISRIDYVQNQKFFNRTIWINNTNQFDIDQGQYQVQQRVYTNGSLTKVGNKKIINATISFTNMNDNITRVIIQYIDKEDNAGTQHEIYDQVFDDDRKSMVLNFDICTIDNENLKSDDYEVHGLLIWVEGENNTQANGIIEVNYTETLNIYNKTAISKMKIQVLDQNEHNPIGGVIIHINQPDPDPYEPTPALINLTTVYENDDLGRAAGYAYGIDNPQTEFWYEIGKNYTFTLQYFGRNERYFKVNYTSPKIWEPHDTRISYNYTLTQNSTIIFWLIETLDDYYTNFSYSKAENTEPTWGENIYFEVNFTSTDDNGGTWRPIEGSTDVKCSIYSAGFGGQLLIQETMLDQGDGNYSSLIDSSRLSAGDNNKFYLVKITATAGFYTPPNQTIFGITIYAKPTSLNTYNYDTLVLSTTNNVSQYFNELINITVQYNDTEINSAITGANVSYNWQFGDGVMDPDPLNPNYYTLEINTSVVNNIGTYILYISAQHINYTKKENFGIGIEILVRSTSINGTTKLLHNSTSIWINDSFTFTYEYLDTLDSVRVGGLEQAVYYWYKMDSTGNPIGDPSENINLVETADNLYALDFKTENREPGDYAIFVTLQKNNYEAANAFIDLSIKYREISASLKATGKEGSVITVVKGKPIIFSLTLTDPTKTSSPSSSGTISTQASTPLKGATVKMVIAELGRTFTFKEVADGVYNLTIDTTDPDYQAFFMPQTLTANITISKTNYVSQTIDFTIVIGMDEWPIPGFPAFYFLMIVGAIVAVVGSLATYRYIQLAKIPKFVKNTRAMKKAMKERGEISESLLYPSKEEYMVKILGDKWEAIGLSLEDILGIERKKGKIAPGTEEIAEDIDGGVA